MRVPARELNTRPGYINTRILTGLMQTLYKKALFLPVIFSAAHRLPAVSTTQHSLLSAIRKLL